MHASRLALGEPVVKPLFASGEATMLALYSYHDGMVDRIGPKKPLRHFLREWRIHRKLTQQQLADRLSTSKGQISNWESGGRGLRADVQIALADALSISPGDLFRDPAAQSADELLKNASPEVRRQAIAIIETLLKTSQR